ncbi:MAG TPA: apolipoprotein N-acyltransferase [Gemmatimonadaceae bacterium]
MSPRRFLPPLAVAIPAAASALLFLLAFPPLPPLAASLVCLVPLGIAARAMADAGAPIRDGVRLGWWFGVFGYGATLYWIAIALSIYTKLAILGYFGALFVMSALTAGAVATLVAARQATRWPMAILLPVTWVAWEKLTEALPQLGFPWLPLGLALAKAPLLAQSVDISGVHGGSFWIAAVNGLLIDAVVARREGTTREGAWGRRTAVAAAILLAVVGYGTWRQSHVTLRDLAPIAIVQPNVPQEEKWQADNRDHIVGMLSSATRAAVARHDAKLVVWPEVALPGYLDEHPEWRDTLSALGRAGRTPILFGVVDVQWYAPPIPGHDLDYDYFNAALLTDSLGNVGAYPPTRKQYLVPVVERVPFLNPRWFGALKYFGGYGRGHGAVVYEEPWGAFGVLICYESIFPSQARALRRNGADVLLNITNDAWFGRSTAPWQHESHMRLRAIETRAAVVRSANTGISSYIDPLGREHGATGLFVPAVRTYRVQTSDARTLFLALGDWVGWGSVVTSAALAALLYFRKRRARGAR